MRDEVKEFDRRGARLVAVAPHHAYHVRSCVGEDGPFPVLVDPALTVSATYGAAFGLFDREWTNRPATFVLDRDGVIRFEYRRGRLSMEYPPTNQLLLAVDGLREKRLLIEALRGKAARVYRAAALALGPIGAEAREAVPTLLEALKDDNAEVRAGAAAALCWIVPPARTGVGPLQQGLKDTDRRVRRLAAETLGEIGADAGQAVPALVRLLADPDDRAVILFALEQIGPTAMPGLLGGLKDKDPRTRQASASAVARFSVQPRETIPALALALSDSDPEVRLAVIQTLGNVAIDPEARKPAVPGLIAALKEKDPRLRTAATVALERLRQHARAAVPALFAVLKDEVAEVRLGAVSALRHIGWEEGDTPTLVKAMAEALGDKEARMRRVAAIVLSEIGPDARDAVPALVTALTDPDARVRGSTASALGEIGPKALAAVPALRRALKDENADVRNAAAEALKKIDPDAAQKAPDG